MARLFPQKKDTMQQQQQEDEFEEEQQIKQEVTRPIQNPIVQKQQPVQVVEREVTLSLINEKINYIITKLAEFEKN